MIDNAEVIMETVSTAEPEPEKRTRSWLCALKLHRRTRWSKPQSRLAIPFVLFFGSAPTEREYWFQVRECLGCGEREERGI